VLVVVAVAGGAEDDGLSVPDEVPAPDEEAVPVVVDVAHGSGVVVGELLDVVDVGLVVVPEPPDVVVVDGVPVGQVALEEDGVVVELDGDAVVEELDDVDVVVAVVVFVVVAGVAVAVGGVVPLVVVVDVVVDVGDAVDAEVVGVPVVAVVVVAEVALPVGPAAPSPALPLEPAAAAATTGGRDGDRDGGPTKGGGVHTGAAATCGRPPPGVMVRARPRTSLR
jgi:hypothetical protein